MSLDRKCSEDCLGQRLTRGPALLSVLFRNDSRRHLHHKDSAWADLGYHGQENILRCRFLNDIDYMLCTRRAETENIGEWTIQAPIPESLWDRQSVTDGKRWA